MAKPWPQPKAETRLALKTKTHVTQRHKSTAEPARAESLKIHNVQNTLGQTDSQTRGKERDSWRHAHPNNSLPAVNWGDR